MTASVTHAVKTITTRLARKERGVLRWWRAGSRRRWALLREATDQHQASIHPGSTEAASIPSMLPDLSQLSLPKPERDALSGR